MTQKSQILLISAVFPPEPVTSAKLSYDIANALAKIEDVCVITPFPSRPLGFEFNESSDKVDYTHILMDSYICPQTSVIGRFIESYSFGKCCYNHISKTKDKISLIYANTWPLLSQFYVVKAAFKYEIPVIIHVQDIYPESFLNKLQFGKSILSLLLLPLDKYVLNKANKAIAVSEKMKKYLINTRGVDPIKVHVVQNWQDEEAFIQYELKNKSTKDNTSPFTFMYLGNIGPVAGVDLLIDSFLNARLENCRLVIAGSGSMKESLIRKTEEFKHKNIEFWSVPDGKVPEIQGLADVLLLPLKSGASLSSIPSKLPAYMFSKKPIIASVDADCDIAIAINSSNCGWVVPSEDVEALSSLMQKVVLLPGRILETIGENGCLHALENYSKKSNLRKLVSIIVSSFPS